MPAAHRVAHQRHLGDPQMIEQSAHVGHLGVHRIILGRAPVRFAETADIPRDDLAVLGERGPDLDPVGGIVVVRAVEDQHRCPARLPEDPIKQIDITGPDAARLLFNAHHDLRLNMSSISLGDTGICIG